jgi:hypothetical protein
MAKWKVISWMIRCVVAANLTLVAWVLLLHGSRAMGITVFWILRASALSLLLLLPTEYVLRRMQGAKGGGLILDTVLMVVMFGTWLTISAATF